MDYTDLMEQFGTKDVTATFGIAPPAEIVGPLKPKAIHYGIAYGSDPDTGDVFTNYTVPLLFFEFNKYRPDLPPWRNVKEIVLAALDDDGGVTEASFIEPHYRATKTTGALKTVEVSAEGPGEFRDDLAIIDRSEVAKQRDLDSGVKDGSEFRVDGVLT